MALPHIPAHVPHAGARAQRSAVLVALGSALEQGAKGEDAALAYVAAGALEDALRTYRCTAVVVLLMYCYYTLMYSQCIGVVLLL